MTFLDPTFVVDPLTLAAVLILIETVRRLSKRVSNLETIQAYNRGFKAGEQNSLKPDDSTNRTIEE